MCLEDTPFRTAVSLSAAPTVKVDDEHQWKWFDKWHTADFMGPDVAYVVQLEDPMDPGQWPSDMAPYEKLITWVFVRNELTRSNRTMDPGHQDAAPIPPQLIYDPFHNHGPLYKRA